MGMSRTEPLYCIVNYAHHDYDAVHTNRYNDLPIQSRHQAIFSHFIFLWRNRNGNKIEENCRTFVATILSSLVTARMAATKMPFLSRANCEWDSHTQRLDKLLKIAELLLFRTYIHILWSAESAGSDLIFCVCGMVDLRMAKDRNRTHCARPHESFSIFPRDFLSLSIY